MNLFKNIFGLKESTRYAIWRAFGSFRANQFATSQNQLIQNSYESNVDVYSCIKKIADICSSVPWIVERKQLDGTYVTLENTTLNTLMSRPNEAKGYTWEDIQFQTCMYILCTGNSYVVGLKPEGFTTIEELDVLPSSLVCIESNKNWLFPNYLLRLSVGEQKYIFNQGDFSHIKFFNPAYQNVNESLYGLSPIQVASRVVQVGNDRWEADANLLQNRGAIGLITDKSDRPMKPEEALQVQEAFDRETAGPGNFGKVKVTNKDLSYIPMAMSSTDMQLVEKGVVNLRAICNVFGLDSSLFNDPANKTFNNRKEAQKALYTDAVIPLNKKIEAQLNRWLVPNHFPNDPNVCMRPDYSKVAELQEAIEDRAGAVTQLKLAGIISANQAAQLLNLPLSEDENADKLIVSSGNILLENINTDTNGF